MNRIYAAGSRRSAQPTYTPLIPNYSTPVDGEELLAALTGGQVAQGGQQVVNLQQALSRGSSVLSGQGEGQTGYTGTPVSPGTLRAAGLGASSLGVLAQQPELAAVGSMLGLSGNLAAAKNNQEALSAFATPVASLLGLPVAGVSFAKAVVDKDAAKMIDSLTYLHPVLGALNSLSALLGIGTIGGALAGQPKLGDYSLATTRPVQSSSGSGGNYSLSGGSVSSGPGISLNSGSGLGLNPNSGGLGLSADTTRSGGGGGWQNGGYGGDNGGPAW